MSKMSLFVSLTALVLAAGCQVGGEEYNKYDEDQGDRGFLPGPEIVGEEVIGSLRSPAIAEPGSTELALVWSEEIAGKRSPAYLSPISISTPKWSSLPSWMHRPTH